MPPRSADEFEHLYATHYEPLCQYAYSYVRSVEVAQEIVSDVFANVWMQYDRWAPAGGGLPYLYRAVRNRVHNHARDRHRWAGRTEVAADATAEFMGQRSTAPDVATETDDMTTRVWAAIGELTERSREVLTLHWRHQLTFPEIAAVLEMSDVAVRVQHSRALAHLRARLGDLFD